MPTISAAVDLPLRIASPEDFACVQEFFYRCAFDDVTLCRTLSIQDMSGFGRVRWEEMGLEALPHPQRWCIKTFLRGLPVAESESRQACGKEIFAALCSLGLLRQARKTPDAMVCPVWVYPVDGFVVASDLCQGSEGEPYTPPPDVVFPAIYAGTLRFLRLTRQFVYGALVPRRYPQAVNQPPTRVHLTPAGGTEDFARLLAWRRRCRQAGSDEWLLHARPGLAPQLQLTVRHAVNGGELAPVEFMFSIERGFQAALRLDGWVVPLLARLEGKRSVAEIIETARHANELPEGFTLDAFADLVKMMIERGFLEVDSPV